MSSQRTSTSRQKSRGVGNPPTRADKARAWWLTVRPWIGTGARIVLAVVFAIAGASKVSNLSQASKAADAYDILPSQLARMTGTMLPFIEMMLALLLILGVATRLGGVVSSLLLTAFIIGIVSAWARGLSIDCGCFGNGGELTAGQKASYGIDTVRDSALLLLALFLVVFPRTRLSVDARIAGGEE